MTPYVYNQYYLALVNDARVHCKVVDAYRGYRGPLNKHTDCFRRLVGFLDSEATQMRRRFRLEPIVAPYLHHVQRRQAEEELYHAVIHRCLNSEDIVKVDEESSVGTSVGNYAVQSRAADCFSRRQNRTHTVQDGPPGCVKLTQERMADLLRDMDVGPMLHVGTSTGRIKMHDDWLGIHNIPHTTKPKEPTIMSEKITIETRTFLNGSDVKNYSDAQLIEKIEQAEAEVTRLKNVKTKSAKIEARIAELETGAAQLAELLDARK